jgi:hypothetical protein
MMCASGKRGARIGSKESKSPISLSFTATPQFDFICTGAFGFEFIANFSIDAMGPAHTREMRVNEGRSGSCTQMNLSTAEH